MVIVNSFIGADSAAVRLQQENVRAVLDKQDLGLGTLFISDSILSWQEKDNVGFSMGFQDISLHAISRDATLHPKDCIYIIVDSHFNLPGQDTNGRDTDSDGSEADISELILEPHNPLTIPALYETLKICQELNPDPNDVDDEDDNLYADVDNEMDEGHYIIGRGGGGGDEEINDLAHRLQNNSVDVQYMHTNGQDSNDELYEDAD